MFDADIDNYAALVSASPTREPFLHLATSCYDGTLSQAVKVQTVITFQAIFWQRIIQSGS
jgi:hypothetical protein